jgi:hypothetical protein
MNVEIGTETPIFLFWEYLFRNFGILSLQCTPLLVMQMTAANRSRPPSRRRRQRPQPRTPGRRERRGWRTRGRRRSAAAATRQTIHTMKSNCQNCEIQALIFSGCCISNIYQCMASNRKCKIIYRISPFILIGSPTESLIPQPIIPEPLIPEPLIGLNL